MNPRNEVPGLYEALSSEARLLILNCLAASSKTVAELSRELNLHPATVRYHLKTLEATGLVEESSREKGVRSGRPMVRYRMAAGKRIHGFPRRQYEMLSDMFLNRLREELGEEGLMRTLVEIGRESGITMIKDLQSRGSVKEWTPELFAKLFVEQTLREMGVIAETRKTDQALVVYREYVCPFQELAVKYPREICEAMDEGFTEGMCEAMGSGVEGAKIKCIGHGDPYCEKAIFWWERAKASAKEEMEALKRTKKKKKAKA
jgi:predicted ArsR family transcriptional regulator